MQNKTNSFFSPYLENKYASARRSHKACGFSIGNEIRGRDLFRNAFTMNRDLRNQFTALPILSNSYFSYDAYSSYVLPFRDIESTCASFQFIFERHYMKRYLIPALLAATAAAATLMGVALNSHAAPVAVNNTTGMMRFEGLFNASACDLASTDINGGTAVPLGSYKTSDLTVANPTTAMQFFPITLTNCDTTVAKKTRVSFMGAADQTDTTLLQLNPGGATGVGIELFDAGNNKLNLGSASSLLPLATGSQTYQFGARYKRTALATGSITAGKANAQATIVISYDDGL